MRERWKKCSSDGDSGVGGFPHLPFSHSPISRRGAAGSGASFPISHLPFSHLPAGGGRGRSPGAGSFHMKVIWTRHAENRQHEWQKTLGITRQEIEALLRHPEQIVPGDQGALVAQSLRANGLLRAPFVEVKEGRKILTVYWTSRIDRYWKDV